MEPDEPVPMEPDDDDAMAIRMAETARRAERKAEERMKSAAAAAAAPAAAPAAGGLGAASSAASVKFMTKAERQAAALARLEERRTAASSGGGGGGGGGGSFSKGGSNDGKRGRDAAFNMGFSSSSSSSSSRSSSSSSSRGSSSSSSRSRLGGGSVYDQSDRDRQKELQDIRDQYLGKKAKKKKTVKPSEKFANVFKFDWEATDDTASHDVNPIYAQRMGINPLFGRGYIAGLDMQEQRKSNAFNKTLVDKRQAEERRLEQLDNSLSQRDLAARERARREVSDHLRADEVARNSRLEKSSMRGTHWREKKVDEMTDRDWRIFREDFNVVVRGGRAPMPLRDWRETGGIAAPILRAIDDLKYDQPSPIQRQAIPIGLEFRDVIGIAETGSGKTCAFVVPMLSYILALPAERRAALADDGPLAMIMAPTRELAQQIEGECQRLSVHLGYNTVSVVGGQSIEDQGFRLRKGVEIVIGTPGRLKDCLESRYLVLNQCNYIVLDEADRMVDMGFEVELNYILDSMGGQLKAEDEDAAYQQEEAARKGEALDLRVTAMFSATMPAEVELLAKKYLRHPAIVSIGDRDSSKNKRIEQIVEVCKDSQKSQKLVHLAQPKTPDDKVIVFVNEKKRCDLVSRHLERANLRCSVLHGGKTQDQREAALASFRSGEIPILVATDVAGRGLDIPDVTAVINFDMSKKIENYCHRIGRTGRAGKHGIAYTLVSLDEDADVIPDLKKYLENTGANVPHGLKQAARDGEREGGVVPNHKSGF